MERLFTQEYGSYINRWVLYCTERKTDPLQQTVSTALDFLVSLYKQNLNYSRIHTARYHLSAIVHIPQLTYLTSGHPSYAKRFMRGIFQDRPLPPTYTKTCNVQTLLEHIRCMQVHTLKTLTFKLVILVALTTAQRVQTLELMDITGMVQEQGSLTFILDGNLKQTKPNRSSSERMVRLLTCIST